MMQPIHFSSSICVVTDRKFKRIPEDKLRQQGLSVDDYGYEDRLPFTKEGITTGACSCIAGGITNGSHGSFFHLNPGDIVSVQEEEMTAALDEDIRRLKEENPDLRAFIGGGWTQLYGSPKLKQLLLDVFERWDIPVSILYGQTREPVNTNGQGTSVHYNADKDTWTVRVGVPRNTNRRTSGWEAPHVRMAQSTGDLKDFLAHIHIDKGDELFINGKKIRHDQINQNTLT